RALPSSFSLDSAEPPELLASLLEVVELVVAGAGRAEQDDVPRAGLGRSVPDCSLERAVVVCGGNETPELPSRLADQMDRDDSPADRRRERCEVLAFWPAAEDEMH